MPPTRLQSESLSCRNHSVRSGRNANFSPSHPTTSSLCSGEALNTQSQAWIYGLLGLFRPRAPKMGTRLTDT